MSIRQRIIDDLKAAMKAGDRDRLAVLRMVRARMQEAEVNLRATKGRDYQLGDSEAGQVLSTYAKQRRDSIASFRQGGRPERAAEEEAELAIVQEYLPKRLSAEELRQVIRDAIVEAGATSPRDVGRVMKILMPRVRGTADGKEVNRMVTELLG